MDDQVYVWTGFAWYPLDMDVVGENIGFVFLWHGRIYSVGVLEGGEFWYPIQLA